jgi:hypothetical protein
MPSASEIREEVALESERRARLSVPAFAGGFLYLLSAIIITSTLNALPKVGLLQGLQPALSGVANPAVSPRAPEVAYISHHALPLIAGSFLAAAAIVALILILLLLDTATRFRRPGSLAAARPLIVYGGAAVVIVTVGHQVVSAIETHRFAIGHDHSSHAVDQALTESTANVLLSYIALLAGLALAVGMIATMVNALRVGLLPRWMGVLGILTGLLIFLPIGGAELQVVPALWLVMMGVLLSGRWPKGDPPAWPAGESRPWPSQAQLRAEREGAKGQPAAAGANGAQVPVPAVPASSRKRRRKRGSRG